MQSATNTSTAADLLKQGAGSIHVLGDFVVIWTSAREPIECSAIVAVLAFDQQRLLKPHHPITLSHNDTSVHVYP